MIDLSPCSSEELQDRLVDVYSKMDAVLKDSGKLIEQLGRLRNEALVIEKELHKRNVK